MTVRVSIVENSRLAGEILISRKQFISNAEGKCLYECYYNYNYYQIDHRPSDGVFVLAQLAIKEVLKV